MTEALRALIVKWRANGARIDGFHATMGIGWKVCADELAAALHEHGRSYYDAPSNAWRCECGAYMGRDDKTEAP